MQAQMRSSITSRENFYVSPSDPASELVAGERLVGRFLGGEADGQVLRRLRLGGQIFQLVGAKEPLEHAVTLVRVHSRDPFDVDRVDTESNDHSRDAESSTASRASQARSAA